MIIAIYRTLTSGKVHSRLTLAEGNTVEGFWCVQFCINTFGMVLWPFAYKCYSEILLMFTFFKIAFLLEVA